jgi:hypothetical protein
MLQAKFHASGKQHVELNVLCTSIFTFWTADGEDGKLRIELWETFSEYRMLLIYW